MSSKRDCRLTLRGVAPLIWPFKPLALPVTFPPFPRTFTPVPPRKLNGSTAIDAANLAMFSASGRLNSPKKLESQPPNVPSPINWSSPKMFTLSSPKPTPATENPSSCPKMLKSRPEANELRTFKPSFSLSPQPSLPIACLIGLRTAAFTAEAPTDSTNMKAFMSPPKRSPAMPAPPPSSIDD